MTAPIRDMAGLVDAARAAQAERDVSDMQLEAIAGMATGSVSKYLAPTPKKNLGPMSTFLILGALGKALVIVDDPEQIPKVKGRWVKRKPFGPRRKVGGSASMLNPPADPVKQAEIEQLEKFKMWGSMGGKKGSKRRMKVMKKRQRQQVASHAARKRWSKRA